jgi:aryl carrier-like protein
MKPVSDQVTREMLREWIATRLDIPPTEIPHDANLITLGMDSMELMMVVNQLRRQGIEVTYQAFATEPTLDKWWHMIPEATG